MRTHLQSRFDVTAPVCAEMRIAAGTVFFEHGSKGGGAYGGIFVFRHDIVL